MINKVNLSSGFTMVEALMTIGLISILSAIATTQYIDFRKEAKTAVTNKKMAEIREALVGNPEIIANGQYVKQGIIIDVAGTPSALSALVSQGSYSSYSIYEKRGWRGPYVNSSVADWSKDAWGTTFSYSGSSRWIKSCGSDAICGGANASDDITLAF